MPVLKFTSEEKLNKSFPSNLRQIHITSITGNGDFSGRYIRANIFKRYPLNDSRVPSIKFILQDDDGSIISLFGFGDIAALLDICTLGDTLVLLAFDVEVSPKQSQIGSKFQLLVDDRNHVKPIVWILKRGISSPESSRSKSSPSKGQKKNYDYTPLNELKINTRVNVYGLITHVKPLAQTSGDDKLLVMSIKDQSKSNEDFGLICNLFNSESDKLPIQAQVGDVIRFHRLKIQNYNNKLQATNGPGFHWLLFNDSYDNISASSLNYTLERQDKEKVQALLEWKESLNSSDGATILDVAEQIISNDPMIPSTSSSSRTASVTSSSRGNDDRSPHKSTGNEVVTYELLKEVKVGTVVNVFGVIIYVKPLTRTKSSQFFLMMNITDQSLRNKDDKLTCNLFSLEKERLPCVAEVGDVILLKRLKIQSYNGKSQGSGIVNWALFRGSSEHPFASIDSFTPNSQEQSKVAALLKWWHEDPDWMSFSQFVPRQYFNLVCQVIGVYLDPDKSCRILRVWDGTSFKWPILKKTDIDIKVDERLSTIAGDLATDVFLFDNHVESTDDIEPGDIIKVTNLHANLVSGKVEMTLHGGTAYKKGVAVLSEASPEYQKLLDILMLFVPEKKERGDKRHMKGSPKSEDSKLGKKRLRKDNEDSNNSADTEHRIDEIISKEYDNIPPGVDDSERDKLAVEAYLNKASTSRHDNQSGNKKIGEVDDSQGSQRGKHSSPNKNQNSIEVNVSCNKEIHQDCDLQRTSQSSSEASPSIWLAVYDSPTAVDDLRSIRPNSDATSKHGDTSSHSTRVAGGSSVQLHDSGSNDLFELSTSPQETSKGKKKAKSHFEFDDSVQIIGIEKSKECKRQIGQVDDSDEDCLSSQDTFVTAPEYISPRRDLSLQREQRRPVASSSETSFNQLSLKQDKIQDTKKKRMVELRRVEEDVEEISSSLDSNVRCNVEEIFDSEISSSTESKQSQHSKESNSDDEPLQCMLQTSTAVVNHPNVKRSKLREVLHHKVPHKFKILVRMLDYHPKPATADNLVNFCCFDCKYMIGASDVSEPGLLDSQKICPNCVESGTVLQPTIIMKFLLSDGKYDIICHLWNTNAAQFFQGLEPMSLLSNEDCVTEVQQYLDQLCPPGTSLEDKPYMECCVFSYTVKGEVLYQMFDTTLV